MTKNPMIPSIRVFALASILIALSAGTEFASAADLTAGPVVLNKSSQDPIIIRGQLQLAVVYARQAIQRLQTAPTAETPETLARTIEESYKQLRFAHEGVRLKQTAAKNARFVNPLLQIVDEQIGQALVHVRNAWHLAASVSPERPDIVQDVMQRLEATISFAEQAEGLV